MSARAIPAFSGLPRLVGLTLRRTASRGAIAWTLLVVVAIAAGTSAPPSAWLEAGASDPHVAPGLARESVWTGFLLAVAPMIVLRAARDAAFWRRRDAAWLASRAVPNSTVFVSAWLGAALASVAFACAFAALAGIEAGRTPTAGSASGAPLRLAGSLPGPGGVWVDGEKPVVWHTDENAACRAALAAGDARAHIELGLGGGAGAACRVVLRARRAAPGLGSAGPWSEESRTSIGNRGAIEVELPRGSGPLEFELELGSPDSRLFVLGEELGIYAQSRCPPSLSILARVALALIAWTAFALGCSTWVSAPSAALAVLAALAPAWWSEGTSALAWLPGADVFEALGIVGAGRVPPEIGAAHVAGAVSVACVGLALGLAGLRRWRRTT